METEFSKRVYQGVRVKHTVKDLLAEKRSRQTNVPRYNGGSSPSQPAFVPVSGSHVLPGYYGMRRPFMADAEICHPSKQFPAEAYSSPLGGKALSCDASSMTGYSSLIDGYYTEPFVEYRNTAFTPGGGSLFPGSALPSILPPFPGDSSHFLLRDAWEQTAADTVSQAEGLCSDSLAPVVAPASLSSPDSGSPVNYRASSRGPATPGSQPYLHSLEEVHYPTLYPPTSGYTCSPYMSTPGDLASKIAPLSSEESDHGAVLSDAPSWSKDDAGSWSPYDIRRAY
ncbi:POU class 2 homeobox associating-factor 2 [Paramormyrops kingsleyae]|uniref:Zgc:158412 n=1 Tax=Paramormyrops kingsleyae TaxID=1676925 RepID=A0A3B3Q5X8_9TELE|nr:uncharacterized protein C11orf53 homolog [Paramormyrops kingsleyae]